MLVLLEYCTQPIFCGIDAITDKYWLFPISVENSQARSSGIYHASNIMWNSCNG